MKTLKLAFVLLMTCAAISVRADANADALAKLAQVPAPPMVITMDQASGSPMIVLTDKGAIINKGATPVPFNQILIKLAALPADAWPNGRVVFYSISANAPPPQAVSSKVETDLQTANIRLLRQ